MSSPIGQSPIPRLATKYSGVPERLAQEAIAAKARLYSHKTLPDSVPRRRTALPPVIGREDFDQAVLELKSALGDDNVELNDKPLADGWYMEHP